METNHTPAERVAMSLDKVKDTIRAMLNLASNDAATDGEVNNALKFAARLMQQHHLTEADCHQTAAEEELNYVYNDDQFKESNVYAEGQQQVSWEGYLALWVSRFVGSVGVYAAGESVEVRNDAGMLAFDNKGKPYKRFAYVFYGLADEVRLANELFQHCRLLIAGLARLRFGLVLPYAGMGKPTGTVSPLPY